ncbi:MULTISPECIES: hypothetical protein [Nostoc]|uniref:Outer membrane protein beta-barrel domain-containing protein n=1 Tax=Nostoc paludosum FACHB-159 TaxID=2692908 RepID=A0ABR8K8F3_9NOSO|nr:MULTISPECIES: hypothetical protein [Nostoc]MBD2678167.1 hypothetical protein [Nostoc sp. FACHB-857]MBD2734427.1 hypothetical protein [Nostoc paludosum FACHB-159]
MHLVRFSFIVSGIALAIFINDKSSAQGTNGRDTQNSTVTELPNSPKSLPLLSQSSQASSQPRERRSYIGVGGGLGLSGGETGLADGGFSILSRIGITDSVSIHNSTVFGEQTAVMPALTIGVSIRGASNASVIAFPFIGGGININTSQNFEVDPLLVAGIDVPLADRLMATTRLNASFGEDKTDAGLLLGIGYRL